MAQLITMPKLSDTMEEGGIASWLKKEGDTVSDGDPLVEIETDKATMEYVSPEAGVLLKILATPGNAYPLQAPLAVIGKAGEKFDLEALLGAAAPKAHAATGPAVTTAVPAVPTPEKAAASVSTERIKASPLAKKLAQAQQVDLTRLQGSGPHGRIIAKDIEAAAQQVQPDSISTSQIAAADMRQPLSMMRKTIAKRLVAAKSQAPHFYLTVSADMTQALAWRQQLNSHPKVIDGSWGKVSVNDLVLFAVARALRKHPAVNTSWQEDAILQHGAVHVAMAVALPTGLITPVVFHADQLGIRQLAETARTLGKKAHKGALTQGEYEGGTFTVSNLGMTLVEEFTAIINPPQSAILAVGCTKKVPVVTAQDTIGIQSRMKMTLSCDHRVIDGMVGAQFLETLVGYLEQPTQMLE